MMNPRVKDVKANPDYTLTLTFDNGEVKIFDMKPYLDKGIFKELKDINIFKNVKPFLGSIQWKNGQDLCPDSLYLDSKSLTSYMNYLKLDITHKKQIQKKITEHTQSPLKFDPKVEEALDWENSEKLAWLDSL